MDVFKILDEFPNFHYCTETTTQTSDPRQAPLYCLLWFLQCHEKVSAPFLSFNGFSFLHSYMCQTLKLPLLDKVGEVVATQLKKFNVVVCGPSGINVKTSFKVKAA